MPEFKKNPTPFMMKNANLTAGTKGSPIQDNYSKPSPAKWAWVMPLLKAAGTGAATALGKKAVSGSKTDPERIITNQTKIMQDDEEKK